MLIFSLPSFIHLLPCLCVGPYLRLYLFLPSCHWLAYIQTCWWCFLSPHPHSSSTSFWTVFVWDRDRERQTGSIVSFDHCPDIISTQTLGGFTLLMQSPSSTEVFASQGGIDYKPARGNVICVYVCVCYLHPKDASKKRGRHKQMRMICLMGLTEAIRASTASSGFKARLMTTLKHANIQTDIC